MAACEIFEQTFGRLQNVSAIIRSQKLCFYRKEMRRRMGDPRNIEALIEALAHPEECDAAAYALGELGDPRAVEPLRTAYTAALVGGDPQKALAPLFADSYGTARDMIIQALAKIGNRRATETLLAALHDPGRYIQSSAYRGLGKLADPRAVEPLLTCLLEDHEDRAAQPLLEIGGSQALEGLHLVLISPEYPGYLRCGVARAFKEQAQPVPDILFHRLQSAETLQERCETVEILGTSGDPRTFPLLLAILNNPQEDLLTLRAAIGVLREYNQEQAVEPLLTVLTGHPSRALRALAAQALSGVDLSEVSTALCEALNDEAASVRTSAAGSLALRDDPQIIPALEAMIAREALHVDALQDYEHDRQYFFENTYAFLFHLPEECAQESIRSIHACYG
jgi:HEAT repeat protein